VSDIIEKLGITPGHYERKCKFKNVTSGIELNDSDFEAVFVESKEMKKLKDSAPEMLELLAEIIKAQNDKRSSLANLNGRIKNAENFLVEKWTEIKELLNEK
jgi:hypothetical protein